MAKESEKETAAKGQEVQQAGPARALSPFEEMDRMFDAFFPRGWMRPLRWELPRWAEAAAPFEGRVPRVDVIDRDTEILVRAEIPGVDRKDLDVSVTDNAVTVKGSMRREEKEERGDYYRAEIVRGSFARTVALPGDVDSARAKASFKDGILELTLPKVEKSKRRSVPID